MRKLIAFVSAFFVMMSVTANASYTGTQLYNLAERSFVWLDENVSPLGSTDSVAGDYFVMAMSGAEKAFDYNKYIKITESRTVNSVKDGQRAILANAAAGGKMDKAFVEDNTYSSYGRASADIASAIIAAENSGYAVSVGNKNTDVVTAELLTNQLPDGSFENDISATAKSIIALSFSVGKRYSVKGKNDGESYFYDVNASILRAVNYLQSNKNEDFGFGNVSDTAYVIMALDSAGVDSDTDLGFSNGGSSTLAHLIAQADENGCFGSADNTATALCAMVSHMLAMQGRDGFFDLRSDNKLKNPANYTADINRSGEGLKKVSSSSEVIEIELKNDSLLDSGKSHDNKDYDFDRKGGASTNKTQQKHKKSKVIQIAVISVSMIAFFAAAAGFVVYFIHTHPGIKHQIGKKNDDEGDG